MIDLNRLFLFIVIVSALVVLARSVRRPAALPWKSALVVLAITAATYLVAPKAAGWVAVSAWVLLLFVPALISNRRGRHPSMWRNGFERERRLTPAVAILMGINALMFVAEIIGGGSTNPDTLHRLGELDTAAVWFDGEYWRLFTALFLHYGPLHLLFNLYALSIIGPGLERAIGALRFTVCYLVAGVGSSAGVVLLRAAGLTKAEQLVGASGCVMGIVGAWAGLLVRNRHAPLAAQRLQNIALIVGIQIVFDLSTPQVSMAAHLSGLVTGFILGLIVASPSAVRA